jgi:hypothetical protein
MITSRHVVVIPLYRTGLSNREQYSLRTTASILARHDIFIVGPHKLAGSFEQMSSQFGKKLQYKTFDDSFFASIDGYNKLLVSEVFYQAFEAYQYMLITQTDALVFRDELDMWADKGFSYIGAPWFEGFTTPTLPLKLTTVGNGGYSLRKIAHFLKVLRRPTIFKNILMESWPGSFVSNTYRFLKDYHSFIYKNTQINLNVNEDVFWGLFVAPRYSFFRVPKALEAVAFAFEAHPEVLYALNHQQLPFGCHAWERYAADFWLDILTQHGYDVQSIKA